jgi:uncharacterized protein (TIGR03435 family)
MSSRRLLVTIFISVGVVGFHPPCGYSATAAKPALEADKPLSMVLTFDVISVKPHKAGEDGWSYNYRPNGFYASNIALEYLIKEAYGIYEDYRIEGLPKWVKSETFDIDAKVSDGNVVAFGKLSLAQRRLMVQAILLERFKLVVHPATKQLPLLNLVIAKGGPRMKQSPLDSALKDVMGRVKRSQSGVLSVEQFNMDGLASMLTWDVGRFVVNKTGLRGYYDFELHWTPAMDNAENDGRDAGVAGPDASLYTALQEQLGLRLEASHGPVDVIVVDNVDRPTAN